METNQGNLERVIARDGRPLSPQESRAQIARIRMLASNPKAWEKSQKDVQEDTKKENYFLRLLPVAFDFRYAGEKDGNVDIQATPKSSFHPSRREADVFHHMAGDIRINLAQKRMVRIEGKLTSPVNFGGGILGHLDQGGTFVVAQQQVGPGHWELTELDVHMDGTALIFKTISVRQAQKDFDFEEVANPMTREAAAKILSAPEREFERQAGARQQQASAK